MSISIPKLLKLKDYITLIGSALGIVALICACLGFNRREYISVGFFLVTLTLGTDMIDGYIARKTKTDNDIGRELDSLSDSLTFGIAPAILTFQAFRTIYCVCPCCNNLMRLSDIKLEYEGEAPLTWLDKYEEKNKNPKKKKNVPGKKKRK